MLPFHRPLVLAAWLCLAAIANLATIPAAADTDLRSAAPGVVGAGPATVGDDAAPADNDGVTIDPQLAVGSADSCNLVDRPGPRPTRVAEPNLPSPRWVGPVSAPRAPPSFAARSSS